MNSPAITPNALPSPKPSRALSRLIFSLAGKGILCFWTGFWAWFSFNVAFSEGGESWLYGGTVIAAALVVAGTALIRPVVGGWLGIGAGIISAFVFPGVQALILMALPPIFAGLLLIIGGSGQSKASHRIAA